MRTSPQASLRPAAKACVVSGGWIMAIARMACSRTLDFPGLGGAEQWSSRGGGRGTEFAQGQGGVDLNPVAVVFEQPAAQAVDHRRRGAGQLGQHLGHLNLHLVVRVVQER